jgi:HSP20 family protein
MSRMMMTPLARRELFGFPFDDFFNDAWALPTWAGAGRTPENAAIARARMDVTDKGEKFEIKVDLPGVKKEDIEVAIEGNRVSVCATVKEEKKVKEGEKLLHEERYTASYARAFELPAEVTEAGSDAAYENGVLTLTLPKRASAATKRLEVH